MSVCILNKAFTFTWHLPIKGQRSPAWFCGKQWHVWYEKGFRFSFWPLFFYTEDVTWFCLCTIQQDFKDFVHDIELIIDNYSKQK